MVSTLYEARDSTKYVTLTVTHQCNLKCSYCYEHHRDGHTMSFQTATSIIDDEMNLNDGYQKIEFDFFGGEPLLEFDLIRDIVGYTRSQNYSKNYHFGASTNGTILTQEMKTWFADNKDIITLGLSLDGTRESHNINRSNSFDLIDLRFFQETYPDQLIKMTISKETIFNLANDVIFCHSNGFLVACNLAYDIDWSDKHYRTILEQELLKLIQFYLDNDYSPCTMLNPERLVNVSANDGSILRVCGVGWSMKAYDVDGTNYPCQHFLPLSVGYEEAKRSLDLKFNKALTIDDIDRWCAECPLINSCPNCYGSNYSATGQLNRVDRNLCELIKIEYMACAYFVSRLYELNKLDTNDRFYMPVVKAALIIDEKITSKYDNN